MTARPVGTLPISATIATSRWPASAAPASLPPGTTLNTPGGSTPSMSSASRSEESGACSGGFITTVLPAASGAADLPAQNMKGWLNGMMRPTTPRGSRTEKLTTSGPIGIESPFISVTRPAKNSICAAAIMASLTISCTGLPQSAASIIASSSRVLAQDRGDALEHLARSSGGTSRQSSKAAFAAATAASMSSAPQSATVPSDSPVPGLMVSDSRPDFGSCQAPP